MKQISRDVEELFREYEGYANGDGGGDEASRQFAEIFMVADSEGGRMVPAAVLTKAVAMKRKMLEGAGSHRTRLVSLEERPLGDWYVLVETEWVMEFEAGEEVGLRSTFILFRSDDGLRIVFYLAHQDLVGVLRERGILVG
jgi:hypothetical protein